MKKINFAVLGLCVFLSGCQACTLCNKNKTVNVSEAQAAVEVTENMQTKYYVVEQNSTCVSDEVLAKSSAKLGEDDYKTFSRRIAIKGGNDNFVTYEYRDIRVDELMPLAARYCSEKGGRTALLRKINMYNGNSRRVTFDCVRL